MSVIHRFEDLPIFGSYVDGQRREWAFGPTATGYVEIAFDSQREWYVKEVSLTTQHFDRTKVGDDRLVDGAGFLPHKSPAFQFMRALFQTALADDVEATIKEHFTRYGRAA